MTADRDRYRSLTGAAVLLVAAIAGAVSYLHIEALAVRYGQPFLAAVLLPLSVDGTVAVSGLTMLRSARAGVTTPWLARTMLFLAVAATLACNVGFGLPHGWPGALLSGWPAVAFCGCAEVAIGMSRRTARRVPDRTAVTDRKRAAPKRTTRSGPAGPRATVPPPAATDAYRASLTAGTPLSERAIAGQFGISRRQAANVRALVTAELNGAGT
jgi:hypothetical protein